jgi:TolA-binding protein
VYWKGEAHPQSVDEDELASFQKAMGLVDSHQKDAALAAFSDFSRNYPNSPLKADADQARARLLAGN